MEDVQDGKKVSIQNGVTEDPTVIEKFDIKNKTFVGLIYMSHEIPNPEIKVVATKTTDSTDKTGAITVSSQLVVT